MIVIFIFSSFPDLPSNKIYVLDFIMKKTAAIFSLICLSLLYACAPSAEEKNDKEKSKQDSVAQVMTVSSTQDMNDDAAVAPSSEPGNAKAAGKTNEEAKTETNAPQHKSSQQKPTLQQENRNFYDSVYVQVNANRKLIKTANLEFKVADVEQATLKIEHLAYRYGGFTLKSEITNTTTQSNTIRINSDSVMEIGVKNIENNMTLRVPQFLLDTLLIKMSGLWVELDKRAVNAEDVTIDYFANDLRAKIHQKTANSIDKAAQQGGRLDDVVEAERVANQFQETAIQKQIDNMSLQDRVDYATVTIHFYQDEILYKKRVASYDISGYEESFGSQFVDALAFGWDIILGFILFFAKGWSVILIMVVSFLVVYYFIRFLITRARKKRAMAK
jgi:hypothetical protein